LQLRRQLQRQFIKYQGYLRHIYELRTFLSPAEITDQSGISRNPPENPVLPQKIPYWPKKL
jgi:hypothetical protein